MWRIVVLLFSPRSQYLSSGFARSACPSPILRRIFQLLSAQRTRLETSAKRDVGCKSTRLSDWRRGWGVAQRINDYCDKAVAHLKARRLEEAYVYANEVLELDGKDPKAAAIRRYTLYALDPKKRLLGKALTLCQDAHQCYEAGDYDKTRELITLAKKWHYALGLTGPHPAIRCQLQARTAYLDVTESLAETEDITLIDLQNSCLRSLGFKVPHVVEPEQQRVDELLAHFPLINQPKGARVQSLLFDLANGSASAMDATYSTLPPIPLNQLACFLNGQVQGAVKNLAFKGGDGLEDTVLRLLDDVKVPGRLHVDGLVLDDFFHLPWACIERILDGRTLRGNVIRFARLQLPSGVDPNELLKLPTICDCTVLNLQLYDKHRPQLPGLPPLFKNAALMEWLGANQRRTLWVTREYLSSGLLGFLDALKKDFHQATQAHSYLVMVLCPDFDVANGLGVGDQQLSNRLGEMMAIRVGENPQSTKLMGHRFETVKVQRLTSA